MADTTIPTPRAPRPRGEGQWGLGYREPLNSAEQIKKEDDGLNVRERIERIFAPGGFRSIGKQDLRARMRWWGLYTQRKQGVPGERTGGAEPEELEDEFFMMRIRIDGGAMTSDQLRAIAWTSERYGRDVADITDRQNVQLHWIRIEDVPAIWERIESVGLSTQEACGDTPRVILGCPLAGVTAEEAFDATPDIRAVADRFLGDPAFSNLPRKYKTSISGCLAGCTNHEINDVSFVGVVGPGGKLGYDLQVGGGLSTNPMFAQRLGAFVPRERLSEAWAGVTSLFREYGYRRSRNHARLKFLVKDWGPERVREVLEQEFLEHGPFDDGPPPPSAPMAAREHLGVMAQRDGRVSVGFAPRAGRIAGHQLRLVADLADAFGSASVRATTQQKLVVVDVEADRADELIARLDELDLRARGSSFRRSTMACTGIEFCKLAIGETKGRASWLTAELEARLPHFDEDVRIHVNGCPNSCARFQVADIGLMSALRVRPDGTKSDAFLVHLGGTLGDEASFGRKVRGVKVYAENAADYLELLLRRYERQRADDDTFSSFVNGLDTEMLARFAEPATDHGELR
ncbi:MAG: nitrite/sulfite reductase [Actinomycetota bacterium]|nr:nitrite/sulfite reductase [Actinomycetota bacterium]MDH5224874.1 nitrite/sulfite reductase [Actinomycetota bacterium]